MAPLAINISLGWRHNRRAGGCRSFCNTTTTQAATIYWTWFGNEGRGGVEGVRGGGLIRTRIQQSYSEEWGEALMQTRPRRKHRMRWWFQLRRRGRKISPHRKEGWVWICRVLWSHLDTFEVAFSLNFCQIPDYIIGVTALKMVNNDVRTNQV